MAPADKELRLQGHEEGLLHGEPINKAVKGQHDKGHRINFKLLGLVLNTLGRELAMSKLIGLYNIFLEDQGDIKRMDQADGQLIAQANKGTAMLVKMYHKEIEDKHNDSKQ